MALRFPAKKRPKPQQPVALPDPHVSMGDEGQGNFQPDAASQSLPRTRSGETFRLEMDLHPEELSLLKKLSEQFVRMLGGITPRALSRSRSKPKPRPRKPKSLPRARSGAAGRKSSVLRRVARRR